MGANILRGGALVPAWRENTTGSFLAAAEEGASFVEFDVQVTADGACVIWHDNTLDYGDPGAPTRVPISELTLAEFKALGSVAAASGGGGNGGGVAAATRLGVVRSFWEEAALPPPPPPSLSPSPLPPSSSDGGAASPSPLSPSPASSAQPSPRGASPPRGRSPPRHWRCARDEAFPTLDEVFAALPPSVGFDIEVKMATPDDLAVTPPGEVERVVAPVLAAVERCCPPSLGARRVVFSSFDPDVCAALRARQSRWPVLFLTTGGRDAHADARRTSLGAALDVALEGGLAGVIADSGALQDEPDFVARVAAASGGALKVLTYGRENDDPSWVVEQARLGVHGVICDDVPAVIAALRGGAGAGVSVAAATGAAEALAAEGALSAAAPRVKA